MGSGILDRLNNINPGQQAPSTGSAAERLNNINPQQQDYSRSTSTDYSLNENPNISLNNENTLKDEDLFQSELSSMFNSFIVGVNQTQISNSQGKMDAYQEVLDTNSKKQEQFDSLYKQGKLEQNIYEKELSRIENQNNDAQSKVDSFNQEIEGDKSDMSDNYVSKLYKLKEAAVQAKGGDSGLWESVKYTMPSIAGSSASLMGQQLAATFGTGLIKKAAVALTEGAIGGVPGEVLAIGGTIATTLGLLVNSRYQETMAELGGQLEENQQMLLEKWYQEHPGLEPDEAALRDIRINARKGKDNFISEQMMLTIPDAIQATIMPGSKIFGAFKTGRKLEQSLKAFTGYNNATRIGTTVAKGYANYVGEKFEEGYQYATGKRFASEALGLDEYEDRGFISNVLSDSHDVLSSISYGPWGTLQGEGRYSEDKEFQFAEQSGGLLAALSGGLASGISISKDINTYRKTNKELQDSGIANPEDKFFRLKDQIYAKHFDKNTVNFLVEGIRNLESQTDENGMSLLTKKEAQQEIANINTAFEKYNEVSRHLDDITPEGRFNLFKSKEQQTMINALKTELFHSSMQMVRQSHTVPVIESVSNINELISKQSILVDKIKSTVDNKTIRQTYNIDSRLKIAENRLKDLIQKKESIMKDFNLTEKELPKTTSVEDSNKTKEYLINDLNLTEEKAKYDRLLEVNDNKSLKKWYNESIKRQQEISEDIAPEDQINPDFAKGQEQRTFTQEDEEEKSGQESQTGQSKEEGSTPVEDEELARSLAKLDDQESAELDAIYSADPTNVDQAILDAQEKYRKRKEDLLAKQKKKVDKEDLEDSNIDETKDNNEKYPFLETAIDALFDLQGKIAKWWNKTIAGEDNDEKLPEQRYFRFLEKNQLSAGTGLQLITKKNNKKLFDQLFDKDAEDYEKATGLDTIYSVFVDKDNNFIYANQDGAISDKKEGNLVYASILTELGVESTLLGDKEQMKKELNIFRKDVLAQTGEVRVDVIKKSNGILVREKTPQGKRKFNPALGYITTDIKKAGLLELPIIVVGKDGATRLKTGQKAQARRLYAYDDKGLGVDLMARNLNESEAAVIVELIGQRMGVFARQSNIDDLGKELDKLVYFGLPKGELKDYTLGIKDGNLYVGKDKIFTKQDMMRSENQEYVANFLRYKKYVNASSKIEFTGKTFQEPILNSETGKIEFKEWGSYQEYLLSNEGGREPLFGTDIPAIGKPKFRNYYVVYDYAFKSTKIETKESEIKSDITSVESTEIKTYSKQSKIADIERYKNQTSPRVNVKLTGNKYIDYFIQSTTNIDDNGLKGVLLSGFGKTEGQKYIDAIKNNRQLIKAEQLKLHNNNNKDSLEAELKKGNIKSISIPSNTADANLSNNSKVTFKTIKGEFSLSNKIPNNKNEYTFRDVNTGEVYILPLDYVSKIEYQGYIIYDAELAALETNKKDDTKNLDKSSEKSTFADSKTEEPEFKRSGRSRKIKLDDNDDISNDDIDDAIKKCK